MIYFKKFFILGPSPIHFIILGLNPINFIIWGLGEMKFMVAGSLGKAGNEINDPIVDPVLRRGPPHANEYGGLSSRLLTLLAKRPNKP